MSTFSTSSFDGDDLLCGELFHFMAFTSRHIDGVAYYYGTFHRVDVKHLLSPNPITWVLGVRSFGEAYIIPLGGDLSQYVKRLDQAPDLTAGAGRVVMTWRTRLSHALGIARGLHSIYMRITKSDYNIHGCIKSSNVLISMISNTGDPLLSETGLYRIINAQGCRTRGYVAPEVRHGGLQTQSGDVYSLGILYWS
ncbi:hypothetical protein L1887_23049 [Cichorium endivia]|nr:hypothetical protein L1887_23049 [Cichorium endivia]